MQHVPRASPAVTDASPRHPLGNPSSLSHCCGRLTKATGTLVRSRRSRSLFRPTFNFSILVFRERERETKREREREGREIVSIYSDLSSLILAPFHDPVSTRRVRHPDRILQVPRRRRSTYSLSRHVKPPICALRVDSDAAVVAAVDDDPPVLDSY